MPPSEQVPDDLAHPLQIPNSIATFPGELPGKRQIPRELWARVIPVNSDVLEVPMANFIATQRLRGQRPGSDSCECPSALHVRNLRSRFSTSLSLVYDPPDRLIHMLSGQILKFRGGASSSWNVGLSIIAHTYTHTGLRTLRSF